VQSPPAGVSRIVVKIVQSGRKILILLDSSPDILLPAKTWAASRKQYIQRVAVKTPVKGCGAEFLGHCLGECERELMAIRRWRSIVSLVS
jgi:hypothetical protein